MGAKLAGEPISEVRKEKSVRERSPREWCKVYAMYNNGCYNNQWMVLDYRYFEPGKGVAEGGFYVLEQIPGHAKYFDATEWGMEMEE